MTKRNKTVLWIAVAVLAVVSVTGAAIATSVGGRGMIDIEIMESGGTDIKFSVPVSFVLMALQFAPDEAFEEIPEEALRYMPVARVVGKELESAPDFTMVEVDSRHEKVLIRKIGKRLVIDVEDGSDVVHVSVPLGVVDRVAKRIEKGRFVL